MAEEISKRVTFLDYKLRLSGKKEDVFEALEIITETFGKDAKLEDVLRFIRSQALKAKAELN